MKRSKLILFFCSMLVVVMLASVIACAEPTPAPAPAPAPAPKPAPAPPPAPAPGGPKYGGILQILGGFSPGPGGTNFGYPPTALWHIASAALPAIETLLREDVNLKIQPWLAESWDIPSDRSSVTLNLRRGVKFHDGTDFNADAVKFNLDAVMEAKMPETALWTSIEVIDSYTIRINVNKWQNSILPGLASVPAGQMISPTAVKTNGVDWCKQHPVGTGPFKFKRYEQDVSLEWEKFDGYWQEGKPYLDGIKYTAVADTQAQILAFQAGEGDMMGPDTSKTMHDMVEWGAELVYMHDGALAFNPDSANPDSPFSKKEVRQAVEYALDREAMAKALGYGIYTAAYQWPRPGSIGYIEGLKREYNPDKAKALLAEAGYPEGFKCKLAWRFEDWSQAVQGYLAAVGIDAEMESTAGGKYQQYQTEGWHNTLFSSVNPAFTNFLVTVQKWFLTPGYYVSLAVPEGLEELYNEAISTTYVEREKVEAVSRLIWEEASVPVTNYQGIGQIMRKNPDGSSIIKDHGFNTLSDIVFAWTPENIWLDRK